MPPNPDDQRSSLPQPGPPEVLPPGRISPHAEAAETDRSPEKSLANRRFREPGSLVRCFYDVGYYFPLPAEHPFPMDKFWRAEAMIRAADLAHVSVRSMRPATSEQVGRVHSEDYLGKLRTGALDSVEALKLGLPAGEALLARSCLEVGGTLAATDAAWDDGVACNLAGGTHHAFPDRGQGYCVLNDVAVAIRHLHARAPELRISVIDTDAHQGNGTHAIFAHDPRVFTYSIHVGRNYPAVKTPGTLDVELPRYVPGSEYLQRLDDTLPHAVDGFRPNFVFWIAGADIHEGDRFGQMRLTNEDIAARDERVLEGVRRLHVPLVVLYGGGYNRDREHTARIHAQTVLRTARFAVRWG